MSQEESPICPVLGGSNAPFQTGMNLSKGIDISELEFDLAWHQAEGQLDQLKRLLGFQPTSKIE